MLIGKKVIEQEKINELIAEIKKKKELQELNNDFVKDHLFDYLTKDSQALSFLLSDYNKKSTKYKIIIKEIRAKLRTVYGLFRINENKKKRKQLVKELISSTKEDLSVEILKTHSSTKERLPFYKELYQKIFKITGKPKKIIDLGCGINPFSVPLMKLKKLEYLAFDLSEEEISLLNSFFNILHKKNKHFKGKADILDILNFNRLSRLRNVEVCFLFKMTDVLDQGRGHKVTEEVIKKIPAKYIVISFATKTMSGKKMTAPKRKWMEWLCRRLGYHYKTLEFENELFYIVEK